GVLVQRLRRLGDALAEGVGLVVVGAVLVLERLRPDLRPLVPALLLRCGRTRRGAVAEGGRRRETRDRERCNEPLHGSLNAAGRSGLERDGNGIAVAVAVVRAA